MVGTPDAPPGMAAQVRADLCASVSVGGAEVRRGRSSHLARGAAAPEDAPQADVDVPVGELERTAARWRVLADAGRRHARVSGDVNPIHLSALTARASGSRRAIADGMSVQARALAALSGRPPDAPTLDVAFREPLLLPATVVLSTAAVASGWDLAVRDAGTGAEHPVGRVRQGHRGTSGVAASHGCSGRPAGGW